jgi:hypothetical protein
MMDVTFKPVAILYAFLVIIISSHFLMNLILAVFLDAYKKELDIYEKEKLKELEKE